jgi:hypothetical protein
LIVKEQKYLDNKNNVVGGRNKGDLKMKKEIYCNGHYLETCKNQEEAERIVARYIKQDLYEINTLGYTNKLPVYEIK